MLLTLKLTSLALLAGAAAHALVPRQDCPAGQDRCFGACTDLQTDATNCGRCGWFCNGDGLSPEAYCAAGECMCPGGPACSFGPGVWCPDFQADQDHCGGCFKRVSHPSVQTDAVRRLRPLRKRELHPLPGGPAGVPLGRCSPVRGRVLGQQQLRGMLEVVRHGGGRDLSIRRVHLPRPPPLLRRDQYPLRRRAERPRELRRVP
jgi:hypothetical protein